MKTLMLFPKMNWSKKTITEYLDKYDIEISTSNLRVGDSYILFHNYEALETIQFRHTEPIYIFFYDSKSMLLSTKAITIEKDKLNQINANDLINDPKSSIGWDIKNMGYSFEKNSDLEKIVNYIESSHIDPHITQKFEILTILKTENISDLSKKILVDIYSLFVAGISNQAIVSKSFNQSQIEKNFITWYNNIFILTFTVKSIFEKIILLISTLDDKLDYKAIQGSKSIKKTFAKQAISSTNRITLKILHDISNVEILDDNFRTPETHKMGRIITLLNPGSLDSYTSLINEVWNFFNWTGDLIFMICNDLRKNKIETIDKKNQ